MKKGKKSTPAFDKPGVFPELTIKPKYAAWLCLGLIIILFLGLYHEVLFDNMAYDAPDSKQNIATTPLAESDLAIPQWHPYMFSGMPSYGSLMYNPGWIQFFDALIWPVSKIWSLFSFIFPPNSFLIYTFLAAVGMVLLMQQLKIGLAPTALATAVFVFTPHLVSMFVFGHGSKYFTAMYIPIILWAVMRLMERVSPLNIALAALFIGFQMQRLHVQIIYYTLLLIGFYFLVYMIQQIRQKAPARELLQKSAAFATVVALGLMLAAVAFIPIHEYTPYSIRGGTGETAPAVTPAATSAQPAADTGVGFDYATNWSFHPYEISTWIIPSFYGFGGQTYWGNMPFTDFPNYMGILTLFLAGCAFFYRRQPVVWFLAGVILLATLISFGKHFFFYRLMYDFLPFFNKFRTPVMILVLVQFSFAILAGLGLHNLTEFMRDKNIAPNQMSRAQKIVLIAAVSGLAFAILTTLFQGPIGTAMMKIYPARYDYNTNAQLSTMRLDMLFSDIWRVALIWTAGLTLIYLHLRRILPTFLLYPGLILLMVIDIFTVDFQMHKPMSDQATVQAYQQEDQLISFLKQDSTLFRVYPISEFGDNRFAAHKIGSIGGYSPAKLRLYQSFLDDTKLDKNVQAGQNQVPYFLGKYVGVDDKGQLFLKPPDTEKSQVDHAMLNVLNTKYVISPVGFNDPAFKLINRIPQGDREAYVYENIDLAPRAYLVGKYKVIPDRQAAIREMQSGLFDPRDYVILEKDPGLAQSDSVIGSAHAQIKSLHDVEVTYESSAPAMLVLSEVYYPDWKAEIDGQPVDIIKADNVIRAVPVPAGKHTVRFVWKSDAVKNGAILTGFSSITIISLFALAFFQHRRQRKLAKIEPDLTSSML